jgi:MoaA/NifB/PqqE/SkfB family radical SAM enzyme
MLSKKIFIKILDEHNRSRHLSEMHKSTDLAKRVAKNIDESYDIELGNIISNDGNWTLLLREKVPENFCLYPFTHFQLDPDGRARPCCKYKVGDPTWQSNVPKLPDVDIGELWDQTEFQIVRDQFLKNERPSGCKACWDEEAAGIKSMRLQREDGGKEHPFATFFHHVPRVYPKTLDLKLSNLCNLKCRICTAFLSSQWIKESKDLSIIDMGTQESYIGNSREKFIANSNNITILKEWAPSIDNLEFYGGEPLMQQEHELILNTINEFGKPENTGLYYNTNGTICNEKFFKLWNKFKRVVINFSIDDIGGRFEYQRKNAVWGEILKNIDLYKTYAAKYGVNIELKIYTTIGILNIFYLDEFLEFAAGVNLSVVLNLVHYPHHFSIVNLPDEVKQILSNKLKSINFTDILDPGSPTINNIINYMVGTKGGETELATFFSKIKLHDDYRNESFKNTFSEFYEIIKHYE